MRQVFSKWLKPLLLWGSIAALILYLANSDWSGIEPDQVWSASFISGVMCLVLTRFVLKLGWQKLVNAPSSELRLSAGKAFRLGWLARYIPGSIPWISGRIGHMSISGFSLGVGVRATLLEAMIQVFSLGFIAVVTSIISGVSLGAVLIWTLVLITFVFAVLLWGPRSTLSKFIRIVGRDRLGRLEAQILHLAKPDFSLAITYGAAALAGGVAHVFIALEFVDNFHWITLLTVFLVTVSGALFSLLAIPLPAGIGLREGVVVAGLVSSVGFQDAIAIALLGRLAMVAADLVFIALDTVVGGLRILASRPTESSIDE